MSKSISFKSDGSGCLGLSSSHEWLKKYEHVGLAKAEQLVSQLILQVTFWRQTLLEAHVRTDTCRSFRWWLLLLPQMLCMGAVMLGTGKLLAFWLLGMLQPMQLFGSHSGARKED